MNEHGEPGTDDGLTANERLKQWGDDKLAQLAARDAEREVRSGARRSETSDTLYSSASSAAILEAQERADEARAEIARAARAETLRVEREAAVAAGNAARDRGIAAAAEEGYTLPPRTTHSPRVERDMAARRAKYEAEQAASQAPAEPADPPSEFIHIDETNAADKARELAQQKGRPLNPDPKHPDQI